MNPFSLLLIIFLVIPIVEIYLLIQVGGVIGALPTVFLVVFTAVLGAWLLRIQGFSTLQRVKKTLAEGGIPAFELLEGLILLIAGALLLTPGFFTDTIGFLCLMPALRRLFLIWVSGRFMVSAGRQAHTGDEAKRTQDPSEAEFRQRFFRKGTSQSHPSHRDKPHETIEGEFRREDDENRKS